MDAVLPFGVAGESCCGLGLRRTGHLGRRRTVAGLGLLFVPAGSPENCRWSERERDATKGERERRDATPRRVTGRGRGAGWTDLRHERERETNGSGKEKNERDERNGGKKKPGCFLSSIQKFKIFFFFFLGDVEGATSTRDGRWMDTGRTLRITQRQ
jgi:hypothetical protein